MKVIKAGLVTENEQGLRIIKETNLNIDTIESINFVIDCLDVYTVSGKRYEVTDKDAMQLLRDQLE